jgi:hypothetical protein
MRTFGTVVELWWAEGKGPRPRTYRIQIDKRITPALGNKLLADIDDGDIEQMRDTLYKGKPTPASNNMAVYICSIVFDFAIKSPSEVDPNEPSIICRAP